MLGRLKTDFAVKTADVYTGRDANGNLIPATALIGGYAKGTSNPALIIINNLATSKNGFSGTDGQFYAYVLVQEVNEFDLFRANTPGTNKQVEVLNRINAENQAKAMGLPEAQPGYRTSSGAVDVNRITQDVANNSGYTGPTHGNTYIIKNGVLVQWP